MRCYHMVSCLWPWQSWQLLSASLSGCAAVTECPSGSTGDAQSLSLLKLLFGNPFEDRLPGQAKQCEDKATRNVSAVVCVPIVDHVATGSPEGFSRTENTWRFALDLEQHLAVNHVTEARTAKKAMRGVTRGTRWVADENRQDMCIARNQR